MFVAQGRLRYTRNWAYLEVDPELTNYYLWLLSAELLGFRYAKHSLPKIQRPTWGGHISVVRKEERHLCRDWDIARGQGLDFSYDNIFYTNGLHFWLDVESENLQLIRELLGLSSCNHLHLTIGSYRISEKET